MKIIIITICLKYRNNLLLMKMQIFPFSSSNSNNRVIAGRRKIRVF